jgi:hypothetical protein
MIKLTTKGVINVIIVTVVFIFNTIDYCLMIIQLSVNYKILLLPRKYVNLFNINSINTDTLILYDLIYPYKM